MPQSLCATIVNFFSKKYIWLLALAPHLLLAFYLGNSFVPYPDQDAYLGAANSLLRGDGITIPFDGLSGFIKKGEPTSYYGLVTPLFLAIQLSVWGENYFFLRLGNIALFGATLFFFHGICKFWLSERMATLATICTGISPFFVIFNQLFLSEMPFLCCELGTFYFLFLYLRNGRTRDVTLCAVCSAIGLLVRTNLLFFLQGIAIPIFIKGKWRNAVLFLALTILIVSPYCIRNCLNNRAFFLFDGKAALNLWQFNSDVHKGSFFSEDFLQAPEMPDLSGLTEKQRADLLMDIGMNWIKKHPAGFFRFMAMRGVRFLSPFPHMSENRKYAWITAPYSIFIIAGFFIGVCHLSWRTTEHLLVVLLFFYTFFIDMIFMSATRHRILFDPFFLLVTFWYLDKKITSWPRTGALLNKRGRSIANSI